MATTNPKTTTTYDRWIALLGTVNQRWQANAIARRELESYGIDPRRFLEHHRAQTN